MGNKKAGTGEKGGDKATAEGKAPESGNSLVATDALPDGSVAITRHGEAEIGDGLFTDEVSPTVEELTNTGEFETEEGETSAGKEGDEGDGEIKESLFEDEGEETSTTGKESKAADEKGEEGEDKSGTEDETKGGEEGKTDQGKEEEGKSKQGEGEGDDGSKPPPGFVSQAALHQMRQKFYAMRNTAEELRRENEGLRRAPAGTGEGETEEKGEGDPLEGALNSFTKKVSDLNLTEEEIQKDPVGAATKMANLLKGDIPQLLGDLATGITTQVSSKTEADQSQRDFQDTVNRGVTLMEKLVPGITDSQGSDVNQQLSDFAVTNGLDVEMLRAMTHPGTIIYPPGGEPRYVEDGAAYFALFLKNAHDRSDSSGEITDEVKEKIKAELEPVLREQIRKEEVEKVMQKLKAGKGEAEGEDFSSLGDIAGGTGEAEEEFLLNSETNLTEAQFAKLTPAQQRKYLGGF